MRIQYLNAINKPYESIFKRKNESHYNTYYLKNNLYDTLEFKGISKEKQQNYYTKASLRQDFNFSDDVCEKIMKKCFKTEKIGSITLASKEDPYNQELIDYFKQIAPNSITIVGLSRKENIPICKIKYYIDLGLMETIKLPSPEGKEITTNLIDLTSQKNQDAIKRCNTYIKAHNSKFYEALQSAKEGQKANLPISILAKLGFGTEDELEENIKNGTLSAIKKELQTKDGKTKEAYYIDVNNPNTKKQLLQLKENDCLSVSQLSDKTALPIILIEDLIIGGHIKTINERLFKLDNKEVLINAKDGRNGVILSLLYLFNRVETNLGLSAKKKIINERNHLEQFIDDVFLTLAKPFNELLEELIKNSKMIDLDKQITETEIKKQQSVVETELKERRQTEQLLEIELEKETSRVFKELISKINIEELKEYYLKACQIVSYVIEKRKAPRGIDNSTKTAIRREIQRARNYKIEIGANKEKEDKEAKLFLKLISKIFKEEANGETIIEFK